jgi:hypothetical protein
MPRMVKFDRRPHLDKLIRELTEAFATRYEEPPSARDLQALEDALEAHVPEYKGGSDSLSLTAVANRSGPPAFSTKVPLFLNLHDML